MEVDIDYHKSIRTQRLQIRPYWMEYLDTAVILLLAVSLVMYPVLSYDFIDWNSPNDRFLAYTLLPLSIVAGVVLFYKKVKEKSLIRIETALDRGENRSRIIGFMRSNGFEIVQGNEDVVIGIREGDIGSWPRQLTVLIEDGVVYTCVITHNLKARMPSFFTAREIIKELREFLAEDAIKKTRG